MKSSFETACSRFIPHPRPIRLFQRISPETITRRSWQVTQMSPTTSASLKSLVLDTAPATANLPPRSTASGTGWRTVSNQTRFQACLRFQVALLPAGSSARTLRRQHSCRSARIHLLRSASFANREASPCGPLPACCTDLTYIACLLRSAATFFHFIENIEAQFVHLAFTLLPPMT